LVYEKTINDSRFGEVYLWWDRGFSISIFYNKKKVRIKEFKRKILNYHHRSGYKKTF